MKRCDCYEHIPVQLLAETCDTQVETTEKGVIAAFTCHHGRTRRHLVCPGTMDWEWAKRRFDEDLRKAS